MATNTFEHVHAPVYLLFFLICIVLGYSAASVSDPIENGKQHFIKCMACHSVDEGVTKIGPSLHRIFNRKSGALEGYPNYSDAMKNAAITWNDETLREFLKAPMTQMKGTRMIFMGIRDDQALDDLIAYLKHATGSPQKEAEETKKQ